MTRTPHAILITAILAAVPMLASSQDNGPSPWRFGVSLLGGASVGAVVEYWHDDFGIEVRLGTVAFQDVVVRLSPKWRGTWDGGEAAWRTGVQFTRGGYEVFHGVEMARVTDGGHVIGGSYNLPLFGGQWGEDEPEDDPEDLVVPAEVPVGVLVRFFANIILGEVTYRYQPGTNGS